MSLVESALIFPTQGPGDSNRDADLLSGAGERHQFAEVVSLAITGERERHQFGELVGLAITGEKRAFLIS